MEILRERMHQHVRWLPGLLGCYKAKRSLRIFSRGQQLLYRGGYLEGGQAQFFQEVYPKSWTLSCV